MKKLAIGLLIAVTTSAFGKISQNTSEQPGVNYYCASQFQSSHEGQGGVVSLVKVTHDDNGKAVFETIETSNVFSVRAYVRKANNCEKKAEEFNLELKH